MALTSGEVSVATTGTTIVTAPNYPCRITISNTDGTNYVSLGPVGVTNTTGYRLLAGETVTLNLEAGDVLAGDADTAAVTVSYILQNTEGDRTGR